MNGWPQAGQRRDLAREIGADVDQALRRLDELLDGVPLPGDGDTLGYLTALADLGSGDLTTARVAEPHLDAAAILTQAGMADRLTPGTTWGVYAAEAPGLRLEATPTPDGWRLTGTKPWCSLAGHLTHAVVTAHTGPHTRRAFAVDLHHPGVTVHDTPWPSRGLAAITSGPVDLADVPADPVGDDDWYLTRPGFAWGGIGVAAVWYGAARALATPLLTSRRDPDQIALMHLGDVDVTLHAAACVLLHAAHAIDAGHATGDDGALLAARVRTVCARAAETVLATVGHATGPAPLTFDEEHARRVADLTVYVRQHHAERDLARIGAMTRGRA